MRATDLMVGDYVLVKPSMMTIKVAAVHQKKVAYHAVTNRLNWVRESLLEPIRLNLEHFEKIGFKVDGYAILTLDEKKSDEWIAWIGKQGDNKSKQDVYKQGYKDAVGKAFDWLIERYENQGAVLLEDINELKQTMEE